MQHIRFDLFGGELAVKMSDKFFVAIKKALCLQNKTRVQLCNQVAKELTYSSFYINNSLKPSVKHFIPWSIIRMVAKYTGISIHELETYICLYGVPRCRSPVINPNLPIIHTPILDMLIAHVLADGCIVRSPGRAPYVSFRQKNQVFMNCFRKQCEQVFGEVPSLYTGKEKTKTYLPAGPTRLLLYVSKLSEKQFFSKSAPMPGYIHNQPRVNQFAFLLAFVFDEGHIDSSNIVIRLKNKNLIQGLDRIAKNLTYTTTTTSYGNGMHQIYIRSASLNQFYEDYKQLTLTYKCTELDYKKELLKDNLRRMNKPNNRSKPTKERILSSLANQPQTVNALAKQLCFTRQGIRYNIQTLMKQGKIRKIKVNPGKPPEYVYALWE